MSCVRSPVPNSMNRRGRAAGDGAGDDQELRGDRLSGLRGEQRRARRGPVARVTAGQIEPPHIAVEVARIDVVGDVIAIQIGRRHVADAVAGRAVLVLR